MKFVIVFDNIVFSKFLSILIFRVKFILFVWFHKYLTNLLLLIALLVFVTFPFSISVFFVLLFQISILLHIFMTIIMLGDDYLRNGIVRICTITGVLLILFCILVQ